MKSYNLTTRIILVEKIYPTIRIKNDAKFGGWWLCEMNKGKKFKVMITTKEIANTLGYHSIDEMGTLYLTIDCTPDETLIIPEIFCK